MNNNGFNVQATAQFLCLYVQFNESALQQLFTVSFLDLCVGFFSIFFSSFVLPSSRSYWFFLRLFSVHRSLAWSKYWRHMHVLCGNTTFNFQFKIRFANNQIWRFLNMTVYDRYLFIIEFQLVSTFNWIEL